MLVTGGLILEDLIHALYGLDLGYVMLQHILDPVAQGDRAGGTAGTRALHLQAHVASLLVEVHKAHIAAVFLDERADSSLYDLLNHLDGLTVVILDCRVVSYLGVFIDDWLVLSEMVG